MNKEFIPYEQALELKELGFDEPCFGYHLTKDLPYIKNGLKFGLEKYIGKHNSYDEFIVSAPLYQQAFRWFREKYNLDSEIYMNHELGVKFYTYLILQLERAVITHKSGYTGRFDTYEEAELECLKKLIELVKTK